MAERGNKMDQETVSSGDGEGRYLPERGDAAKEAVCAPPPLSASFTVKRTDLLRDMAHRARACGIVLVVAPTGFGKTALLIQYVDEVCSDLRRGQAVLFDIAGTTPNEALRRLHGEAAELDPGRRPLIAIDNIPAWSESKTQAWVDAVRSLRNAGFEVVMSCVPSRRKLIANLGDAAKYNAQALTVRPREYPVWMKTFSLPRTLDIYELTQGIPVLMASLASWGAHDADGRSALDEAIGALYRTLFDELSAEGDHVVRAAALMVLLGKGSTDDMGRCGPAPKPAAIVRLTHDYPAFGYDPASHRFRCLGASGAALDSVRSDVAARYPSLVKRAVRLLLRFDRIDEAVDLMQRYLERAEQLAMVDRFPVAFSFAGHAGYVARLADEGECAGELAALGTGIILARCVAVIMLGDFRLARTLAGVLSVRAASIPQEIAQTDWACACALSHLWRSYRGIDLPRVSFARGERTKSTGAYALQDLDDALGRFFATPGERAVRARRKVVKSETVELDVGYAAELCAKMLDELADGSLCALDERDRELEEVERLMRRCRLAPLQMLVRLIVSFRRLFAGAAVVDERAFSDAGTMAIRLNDQPLQLLSMMLEGWQNLALNQAVNAQFRGQQVLRLSESPSSLLGMWSTMLERAAHVIGTARVAVLEEAELLDLTRHDCSPAQVWGVAFTLSGVRLDGELAAWYSLHKEEMLDDTVRLPARLALSALGSAADSLRRLIPRPLAKRYLFPGEVPNDAAPLFYLREDSADTGQYNFRLFGGFTVERNGHIITDAIWRRRKVSVLAARLVLGMGAFINRRTLMDELWPDCDYRHARGSLYSALSVLRRALGQAKDGPQYLLVQGEGIAVNGEYMMSDIQQFDILARDVLLKRKGVTAQQVIDTCLKIEQLYQGPLYVPDRGNPTYFLRMKSMLQTKFVDCMLRGTEVALDENDITSASWMVESALGQMAAREDVIRAAMKVFDLSGRRKEVVELYNSHLHDLERQAKGLPEPETRELYEQIINQSRAMGFMHT